jgi:hypothetical protein
MRSLSFFAFCVVSFLLVLTALPEVAGGDGHGAPALFPPIPSNETLARRLTGIPLSGILYNLPVNLLTSQGCSLCPGFPTTYASSTTRAAIASCPGAYLIAGARHGSASCLSLAAADRNSVVTGATPLNAPTLSAGVYWYNTASYSFGFSGSPSISQYTCDVDETLAHTKLCWHVDQAGGYRVGQCKSLNSDTTWKKELFSCPWIPLISASQLAVLNTAVACSGAPNCPVNCDPGYSNTGGACALCTAGYYNPVPVFLTMPCTPCPAVRFACPARGRPFAPRAAACPAPFPLNHSPPHLRTVAQGTYNPNTGSTSCWYCAAVRLHTLRLVAPLLSAQKPSPPP